MEEKKHISKTLRRFWGVGEFGEGMSTSPAQLYGTFFLTDVIMVSPPVLAITTMISSIVGFFIAPFSAIILDGTKPMRWGKLRSWLIVGPIALAVLAPLVFVKVGTATVNAYLICLVSLIQSVFYNTTVTANYALVPSMCAYEEEKNTLTSNHMTGFNIGRMVSSYFTPFLLTILLTTSLGTNSYYLLALCGSLIMVASYFMAFKLSKGYEGNGHVGTAAGEKLTLKQIAKAVAAAPQILVVLISDVTSTMGSFLLPGLLVYMYRYVIQDGSAIGWMATHNLVTGLAGMIGAFAARWVMKKIPNRRLLLCGVYLVIAAFIFMTRFFTDNVFMFIAMSATALFFQGVTNPVEGTLYFDVAVIAQEKTGRDITPTVLALSQLNARIAVVLRGIVISVLFNMIAYDPTGEVSELIKAGFTNAYSLTFCFIPIIGAIVLFFFYKLTPERVAQARANIEAKAGSAAENE